MTADPWRAARSCEALHNATGRSFSAQRGTLPGASARRPCEVRRKQEFNLSSQTVRIKAGVGKSRLGRRLRGFTLIELLVTLIVAAVLLAIAVPALSTFVDSSRLRASQSELVSALTLARSEATKRGSDVMVEASAADPVAGKEFNEGWRVKAGAEVVREYPAATGHVRFGTVGGVKKATFNSRGFLTTGEIVFTVCGKAGVTKGYRIRLEPVGIADVEERNDACT
jgi:type IV fimbrial biogenesis protein FimT